MTTQVTDRSWNEAVARQFPWISEQFDINSLTSRIKISKVSTELLEVVPSEEYGTDLSGYYTHDCVQFHDDDGQVIGEVNPKVNHSDANCMNQDRDGETIGDRWYALDTPMSVAFITRKTYYSGGCLSHDPDASDLEIFKVARFDVDYWLAQRDKASDVAITSTGLGPDDSHDKIKLAELRHALDTVYRNFALEEIRGLDKYATPKTSPWVYAGESIYQFLCATDSQPKPHIQESIDIQVDQLFDLWGELEDALYERVGKELASILKGTDARTFWECAQAPIDLVVFDGSDTPLRNVPDAYLVLRRINHRKRQAIINGVSEILGLECPEGLCDLQGKLISPPEWAV